MINKLYEGMLKESELLFEPITLHWEQQTVCFKTVFYEFVRLEWKLFLILEIKD